MPFPRPDQATRAFFDAILTGDPRVQVRPMFGNLAAFVNGNMFAGVFGSQVFVRLAIDDREELLQEDGTSVFSPMKGRAMKEYVTLPDAWRDTPDEAEPWVARSLVWVGDMPAKKKAKR